MEDVHHDDDSCSVASSTSWWMLEDDNCRKTTPRATVIKLNQQLYEILVDISSQSKCLGPGFYWKSTKRQKAHSWDEITAGGHKARVILPLCYLWFGHIRLAMMEMGVANEETIYWDLMNMIKPLRAFRMKYRSMNLTIQQIIDQSDTSNHMPQPLYFIIFTHVLNDKFEVIVRDTLMSIRRKTPGVSRILPHRFKHSCLGSHLHELRLLSHCHEFTSITRHHDRCRLTQFKSSSLVSEELELKIPTGNNDHLIEENWKKGFALELEKSFALVHKELSSTEDIVIDEARMNEVVFLQHPHTERWVLNPFIVNDIEVSLRQVLKDNGEEVLTELLTHQ